MATKGSSSLLRYPCASLLIGPTMSGKTHLLINILNHDLGGGRKPEPSLPNGAGLPKRILLISQFDASRPSVDEGHRKNIQLLNQIRPCINISIDTVKRMRYEEINGADGQDYEEALENGDIKETPDSDDNDFQYLVSKFLGRGSRILQEGDLVIFDDMQEYFSSANNRDITVLKRLLQEVVHHKGISVFCLLQTLPKGRIFTSLIANSQYIMTPTHKSLDLEAMRRCVIASRSTYKDILPPSKEHFPHAAMLYDKTQIIWIDYDDAGKFKSFGRYEPPSSKVQSTIGNLPGSIRKRGGATIDYNTKNSTTNSSKYQKSNSSNNTNNSDGLAAVKQLVEMSSSGGIGGGTTATSSSLNNNLSGSKKKRASAWKTGNFFG